MSTRKDLHKEALKDAYKEALKEFLDEKFAKVGKWSLQGISIAALGVLVYLILWSNGWNPPK